MSEIRILQEKSMMSQVNDTMHGTGDVVTTDVVDHEAIDDYIEESDLHHSDMKTVSPRQRYRHRDLQKSLLRYRLLVNTSSLKSLQVPAARPLKTNLTD